MKKIPGGNRKNGNKTKIIGDFIDIDIFRSEVMNWLVMSAYPPVSRKINKRKRKNSDNKLNKKEKVK